MYTRDVLVLQRLLPPNTFENITELRTADDECANLNRSIFRAHNIVKGRLEIIKLYNRTKEGGRHVLQEIAIHRTLGNHAHPYILGYYGHYMNETHVALVVESVEGTLFSLLKNHFPGGFSEPQGRNLVSQICTALSYIHHQGITHRDIKLETIFYSLTSNGSVHLKLGDFSISKFGCSGIATPCGTLAYAAPEIASESGWFCQESDLWSLGCVVYTLLSGFPPFWGDSDVEIREKIVENEWSFLAPWWNNISKSAKEAITGLLEPDVFERWTIQELLTSSWMQGFKPVNVKLENRPLPVEARKRHRDTSSSDSS